MSKTAHAINKEAAAAFLDELTMLTRKYGLQVVPNSHNLLLFTINHTKRNSGRYIVDLETDEHVTFSFNEIEELKNHVIDIDNL